MGVRFDRMDGEREDSMTRYASGLADDLAMQCELPVHRSQRKFER